MKRPPYKVLVFLAVVISLLKPKLVCSQTGLDCTGQNEASLCQITEIGVSRQADSSEITDPETNIPSGEKDGAFPRRRGWVWRKASSAEFGTVAIAGGVTLYSENAYGSPTSPHWTAHNEFDDAVRNALRLHTLQAQNAVADLSDALMGLLIAEPIIDSFVFLGYRDHRWDELWQTSVINLESFTFTALASSVMQNSIRRQKPYVRECPDGSCTNEQPNRGMPSGHVAFAFTGAGLYCTHNSYQSYSGNPEAERLVCATSLGLATMEGILRIAAERHFATDVLAGSAIGLFSGFLLPRWLHYYWRNGTDESDKRKNIEAFWKNIIIAPQISYDGGGLSLNVTF